MFIGIDVGGTYTDGVVVSAQGDMLATAKYPTSTNLLAGLTGCLDQLLTGIAAQRITRVAISTTILTNAVLQNNLDPITLWVMPGPGLATPDLDLGVQAEFLEGAIDFRGREITALVMAQVRSLADKSIGYHGVAVAGKFAQRNNLHELAIAEFMANYAPQLAVELSHKLYSGLNFPRRANSTYLTAASRRLNTHFLQSVVQALKARGVTAPLFILKADGGTLPLATALYKPIETVYSGPAASVLGVMALGKPEETVIVMDVGGTTTDLGLVLSGKPLLGAKGAVIGPYKTQVRSFAVTSVNVGGDSSIESENGVLKVQACRKGQAYSLGGPVPTLTDALRYLEIVTYGSRELATEAMERLAAEVGITPSKAASQLVEQVVERLCEAIRDMIMQWEREPAYRVWEVLNPNRLNRFKIVGVGGGAQGLTALVAQKLKTEWTTPAWGKVANAVGAALARPTFSCSLRVDTDQGLCCVGETGEQLLGEQDIVNLAGAKQLLTQRFADRATQLGLAPAEGQFTKEEVFNIVRAGTTEGKIIEVTMELAADVITRVKGG